MLLYICAVWPVSCSNMNTALDNVLLLVLPILEMETCSYKWGLGLCAW